MTSNCRFAKVFSNIPGIMIWLVVYLPPWKILVNWDDYFQYMEKKCSKPPTSDYCYYYILLLLLLFLVWETLAAITGDGFSHTHENGNLGMVYSLGLPHDCLIWCSKYNAYLAQINVQKNDKDKSDASNKILGMSEGVKMLFCPRPVWKTWAQ